MKHPSQIDVVDAVRGYAKRGWKLVRVPPGSKAPFDREWQTQQYAHGNGSVGTAPAPDDDLKDDTTVFAWLDHDIPEPVFLLGEVLSTTNRGPLVANTGVGKTNFIMAMTAAIADSCGVRWCERIRQRCTSLAVAIRFADMPALTPSRANSTSYCTIEINSAEIGYCDNQKELTCSRIRSKSRLHTK